MSVCMRLRVSIWPTHVERCAVSASRAAKLTLPSEFWMLKSSRFWSSMVMPAAGVAKVTEAARARRAERAEDASMVRPRSG